MNAYIGVLVLLVECKVYVSAGESGYPPVLPSRTAIEDMGFRLMDSLLKLGRNELAKSVQKQQMERLEKGLQDREKLMKSDQVDLVGKSGHKIVEILRENGISVVDFFRKMQKVDFNKDFGGKNEDAKSLLDRLRLEILPNVVSNVIHGREMDDGEIVEPQLHPVTDQQQHHFIDQEQQVLDKIRVPEFQSVPELRFMTPATTQIPIPSMESLFPSTTLAPILSIRNSFPNLEELNQFMSQFPANPLTNTPNPSMNSDNPSMSRVSTTNFNVAPTPEGLRYDFTPNPLMNPMAQRPTFAIPSSNVLIPSAERPRMIGIEREYQRIVGSDQDLLMKSSMKRPFPSTERPPKSIALRTKDESNDIRSFSYADLLLKEMEPLLNRKNVDESEDKRPKIEDSAEKQRRIDAILESNRNRESSTIIPKTVELKWIENRMEEAEQETSTTKLVDVKPIPEDTAKYHRLKIKKHQLKDIEGHKRLGWEINNDPDYAEYEVRHQSLTNSGSSTANKRRFL
ncbi:unnamed protein product [Bursaphelenchus xylophilus]|uniref:(pine wood nematode) hypothetical protein n=1 Tax=Bursaphelenchus xylophilus TaxID=6326 RepID=A0A7I8XHR8_BURXY|nr:unnamed protein product [Bursaphelenchus xylophilus]CAG9081921.1 unnamed protein product [Bursaphelenchus xylophilus]